MKKYLIKKLKALRQYFVIVSVCKHENRTWIRGFGDQCIDCGEKLYLTQIDR